VEAGEPAAIEAQPGATLYLQRLPQLAVVVVPVTVIMMAETVDPAVALLVQVLLVLAPRVREIMVEREKPGIREEPAILAAVVAGHPQPEERPQV
jgi:hypothetical protein